MDGWKRAPWAVIHARQSAVPAMTMRASASFVRPPVTSRRSQPVLVCGIGTGERVRRTLVHAAQVAGVAAVAAAEVPGGGFQQQDARAGRARRQSGAQRRIAAARDEDVVRAAGIHRWLIVSVATDPVGESERCTDDWPSYLSVVLAAAAAAAACGPPAGDAQVAADADALLEVRVVTSGGLAAAYDQLAPRFQDAAGISLVTAYGASGGGASDSIPARLERREPFDVLIMSQAGLLALIDRGLVQADTRVDLASSGIGVAVREGAPLPDVSTPEAFARALLAAESIGYSASVSGTYLSTELLPRIGLWEQLEPKSRRIESERVAAVVARGRGRDRLSAGERDPVNRGRGVRRPHSGGIPTGHDIFGRYHDAGAEPGRRPAADRFPVVYGGSRDGSRERPRTSGWIGLTTASGGPTPIAVG